MVFNQKDCSVVVLKSRKAFQVNHSSFSSKSSHSKESFFRVFCIYNTTPTKAIVTRMGMRTSFDPKNKYGLLGVYLLPLETKTGCSAAE